MLGSRELITEVCMGVYIRRKVLIVTITRTIIASMVSVMRTGVKTALKA